MARRRKPKQLSLPQPRTRGGVRKRAGRPRQAPRELVPHRTRARFDRLTALHVTLRVSDALSGINLRGRPIYAVLWRCLLAGCERDAFRLVHYSVQRNHVHLIVEAHSNEALARGIQGLKIRVARRLNAHMRRCGTFWGDRYHAHLLRTPTEIRRALRYVLLNRRRHSRQARRAASPQLDALSSAAWFDGWLDLEPCVSARLPTAQSFLLSIGWQRAGGLIDPADVPGPSP